eukprot:gene6660-3324_t
MSYWNCHNYRGDQQGASAYTEGVVKGEGRASELQLTAGPQQGALAQQMTSRGPSCTNRMVVLMPQGDWMWYLNLTTDRGDTSRWGGLAQQMVCSIAQGCLSHPDMLHATLKRAASMGLSLAGMQTVYLSEEACTYVAAHTPHRPRPFIPLIALALVGRGPDPYGRWRGQLGSPEISVAQQFEPGSLHAMFGSTEDKTHHTPSGCSQELSLFFGRSAATAVCPSHELHSPGPLSPPVAGSGTTAPPAPPAPLLLHQLWAPKVEVHWAALPAASAAELAASFRLLQHLAWCGFGLRGLVRYNLPEALLVPLSGHTTPDMPDVHHGAVLIVELAKEECGQQLTDAVAAFNAELAGSLPAQHAGLAGSVPVGYTAPRQTLLLGRTPEESERLKTAARPLMLSLPGAMSAQELVDESEAAAAAASALSLSATGTFPSASARGAAAARRIEESSHTMQAVDGLTGVIIQPVNSSRAMQDAFLMVLALMLGSPSIPPSPSGEGNSNDTASLEHRCEAQCELVACRLLKQVPAEVIRNLPQVTSHPLDNSHTLQRPSSGTIASTNVHVVPGHPALLLMLHGPDPWSHVSAALKAVQQMYSPHAGAMAPHATFASSRVSLSGDTDDLAAGPAHAAALRSYLGMSITQLGAPTAMSARTAMVIGSTITVCESRSVLAHSFNPLMVSLDLTFHDGLRRPELPALLLHPKSTDEYSKAVTNAAALHVMTTPHLFSGILTVGADDLAAPNARVGAARTAPSVLPRILKLLQKESFEVLALTMAILDTKMASALSVPSLDGHPAVVVLFRRSNAVLHIQQLIAASALPKSSAVACASAAGSNEAVSLLWPQPVAVPSVTVGKGVVGGGAGGGGGGRGSSWSVPARAVLPRTVVASGVGMMQVASVLVLPCLSSETGPKVSASLDLAVVANALDALRKDGFSVVGMKGARMAAGHVGEVGKVCKLSAAQRQALMTATAAGSSTANVVVLAVSRENAVLHLQLKMQEASMPRGATFSGVARHLVVASTSSNVQQQLGLFDTI